MQPPPRLSPGPRSANRADPCLSCGRAALDYAFAAAENGFEVRRCSGCGLGLTWPPVPDAEIGSFYPATYYGRENVRFNLLFERLTRLFRLRRARVIRRKARPGPILDVGCGRGLTLNYLRDLGLEPYGLELSDTAAWHARNALGLPVETGDFLRSSHKPGFFSAVMLWHSLEHMSRPVEALRRARELLRPGGLLVVAVPNFSSLQARLFGRHWFHLDVPRHYIHFSLEALERLLRREGFRIVKTDHFSFEQNPYGWLQSALNALGFDYNFLYAALKNRSARTFQLRRHPAQALLTALLLAPFTALALGLTLLEAALKRGGTVELYAVKE